MASFDENQRIEYAALMNRGRDAERTSHLCWIASGIAATVLLSWGIDAKSPGMMIPVVLAIAYGYYTMVHGRQQTRLVAGYIKEFVERDGGSQWFTRLGHLEIVPNFNPSMSDWLSTALANAVVVIAVVLAWLFAGSASRGELFAGIVTGCAVAFAIHSVSETGRIRQSDPAAFWRQVSMGPTEEKRPSRFASR